MTIWCCVTPEREAKTRMIMSALAKGWPGGSMCVGVPPNRRDPFVAWGQTWLAADLIRLALKMEVPFYQIDNAFFKAARGTPVGYYRFMYCRPDPVFFEHAALRRRRMKNRDLWPNFRPWRKDGRHVLIAMPGPDFGRAFGIDVAAWSRTIVGRVGQATGRPLVIRDRSAQDPLEKDLENCWALVTHSSNVAVEAVRLGIPVFVEPTSSAAPVGNLCLDQLDSPEMQEREDWWASLMCQQFTLAEMENGIAAHYLMVVAAQSARAGLPALADRLHQERRQHVQARAPHE